MKKFMMVAGAAALAVCVTGCSKETRAEKQVENQADALGDAYKADADLQRSLAKGAPDQQAQDKAADRTEKKGEAIEKHLKNEADELGDDTKRMRDAKNKKE